MKYSKRTLRARVLRGIFHMFPRRTKKLVFLSSLCGKITGNSELERQIRLRLQEEIITCSDPDAMTLPLAFNDKIWANRPIESVVNPLLLATHMNDQEITRMARQIVAMMPCWLVYTQISIIVDDVRKLLAKRENLFTCNQVPQ